MCLDDSFDRRTWVQFWRNHHDGLKKVLQVVKSPDATRHASSNVLALVEQVLRLLFTPLATRTGGEIDHMTSFHQAAIHVQRVGEKIACEYV
jgi:hypothetical protein